MLPEGFNIHDVIPDWDGNLWFVTGGNLLGYRNAGSGEFFTYELEGPGETIQNSFAVDEGSLPEHLELTHLNLNDHTVEGIRHKTESVFSVQYHPEAAPGPLDSAHLFHRFRELVTSGAGV